MEADSFLTRTRRLLWLRRGLGGAGLAGTGVLLAGAALQALSGSLPPWAWLAVPAGALVGGLIPREPERELLWAGRRLGVGGRLAALRLLLRRGEAGLAALVRRELAGARLSWMRVFTDRGAAFLALTLSISVAAFFLVPPFPSPVPPPVSEEPAPVAEAPQGPEPAPRPAAEPAAPERMPLPPETTSSLPFQDLLAEVYGLTKGEGPWASGDLAGEIQAQQGLLRELARELTQLAPGGYSQEEQRALLPMIQQLARQDLREELLRLVRKGDEESAARAAQAAQAVERAGEELARGAASPAPSSQGAEPATSGEEGAAPRAAVAGGGAPAEGEGADSRGEARAEEEGALAGLAPGELGAGEGQPPGTHAPAQAATPEVRPGEGPARGYLSAGVPVEPEGEPPPGAAAYSPEETELILRERGVPLELRGVVRRYFELLSQGGEQ